MREHLGLLPAGIVADYVHSVRYMDESIAGFFAELKAAGVLGDCIVPNFGDHDSSIIAQLERELPAVSCHLLLAAGLATIWWVHRRVAAPGPRAYWTTWIFLVLLELYCGHTDIRTGGSWNGTVFSICLAALILLPLRCIERPNLAAWAETSIGFMMTLTATAMVVYFDFSHDYPGLRDLLYSGRVGDVGDSLDALIGQRHLLPWLWWLCCVGGLVAARISGTRRSMAGAAT